MDTTNTTDLQMALGFLLKKIKEDEEELTECEKNIQNQIKSIKERIKVYRKGLNESARKFLDSENLTWCTECDNLFSKDEFKVVYIKEIYDRPCGYEGMCTETVRDVSVKRLCSNCHQRFVNVCLASKSNKEDYSRIFQAEKREDGFYFLDNGAWIKVDVDTKIKVDDSQCPLEKVAKRFNGLPPQVYFRDHFSPGNRVVVKEW